MPPFQPEPEQIMAIAEWLMSNEIKEALALYMPKLGGPPAARANRVADVAAALQVYGAVKLAISSVAWREQRADWERCMVGSCKRHQTCMYRPCRAGAAVPQSTELEETQ